MRKINFKAEAHKALTRILSIESRAARESSLAAYFQGMHDLGERAHSTLAVGREIPQTAVSRETIHALGDLDALKKLIQSLANDLKAEIR